MSKYLEGRFFEKEAKHQAPDAFKRFVMELGKVDVAGAGEGHQAWTKFQAWCHEPTWEHPHNRIKLQLNNAKGSCFTSISLEEFDLWYRMLLEWRVDNKHTLSLMEKNSQELLRRKSILAQQVTGLADLGADTTPFERLASVMQSAAFDSHYKRENLQLLKQRLSNYVVASNDAKVELKRSILSMFYDAESTEKIYKLINTCDGLILLADDQNAARIKTQEVIERYFQDLNIPDEYGTIEE